MIIKDAFRSLRQSFSHAFFFWLTFVLSTMFIFLFFNISMSDAVGVVFIDSKADLATNMTILVILFCSVNIFFANDFFARSKTRELAVRIVSGATYIQLAFYLLVQTFILLVIAIPAGILLALCVLPLLNQLLSAVSGDAGSIVIRGDAVFTTSLVLLFLIFWTTLLNMSLAYKNSASALMNQQKMKLQFEAFIKPSYSMSDRVKRILFTAMFALPAVLLQFNPYTGLLLSAIGIIGFNGFLKHVFVPWLSKTILNDRISDPEAAVSLGFFRNDLQILKNNILLYYVNAVFLLTLVVSKHETAMETMMVFISYAFMNVLQSMSMMFRYCSDLPGRLPCFMSLSQIGYTSKNIQSVIARETLLLYGSILLPAVLYDLSMLSALVRIGDLSIPVMTGLLACVILPILFCFAVSYLQYRRLTVRQSIARRANVQ